MRNPILKYLFLHICLFGGLLLQARETDRQSYKIYVDDNGVMRRSDTKEEVAYYGTNYTLPFAHAYRAIDKLELSHKEAIDKDVYHLKRLGFNGFRLHLWDVEISDSLGNLVQNNHLDLLDYLIAQLEKEGIDIILTAQTNFGNGYPEKNIDTGGFSYNFDKCDIHQNPEAQKIQANYLQQLASHINPYTGLSYGEDNAIIAMEINNEPCHTAPKEEVTAYINMMAEALKKGGFDKPVLYNVSHNPEVTEAYYDADIQGTTYQWYPTGLVAGHLRKGNFLPYVDNYNIPWKETMENYDKLARVVYEFDPGDVLYSYLYPAIARTFRKEGFQWITQFAYDPIDIAKYNTEYQTHFLNLAYTPSKAISMMIAGEATRNIPRGADFGTFPNDTVFGDFLVSYPEDLSVYNSSEKFYHSNTTTATPKEISKLKHIAGVGSSPLVEHYGTGAYFLDDIGDGVWRLELMPDVVLTSDPFEKPSLDKEIAKLYFGKRSMAISLPQLGEKFFYQAIDLNNKEKGEAVNGVIDIDPGVYLLASKESAITKLMAEKDFEERGLRRYETPDTSYNNAVAVHSPKAYIDAKEDLMVEAEVICVYEPQNVWIYPDYVSFWNDNNVLIPMKREKGNTYKAVIPKDKLGWNKEFKYNIIVEEEGHKFTFPQNIEGTPLDWDFTAYRYYTSRKINEDDAIVLLSPRERDTNLDIAKLPDGWDFRFSPSMNAPVGRDYYSITSTPRQDGRIVLKRYVGDELSGAPFIEEKENIVVKVFSAAATEGTTIGLTGKNGATYSATLSPEYLSEIPTKMHSDRPDGVEYRVPLTALKQTPTLIVQSAYPSFLEREINVAEMPFDIQNIDFVEFTIPTTRGNEVSVALEGIWLE